MKARAAQKVKSDPGGVIRVARIGSGLLLMLDHLSPEGMSRCATASSASPA
jgi:hypothetical protein